MDRNSIIGIILIAMIFVLWSVFNKPSEAERQKMQRMQDSIAQIQRQQAQEKAANAPVVQEQQNLPNDSVKKNILSNQYGTFSSAALDTNQY
jgi:YidC/Oxa1 family membrane protein insertase